MPFLLLKATDAANDMVVFTLVHEMIGITFPFPFFINIVALSSDTDTSSFRATGIVPDSYRKSVSQF